jgi:hypothetical protein
MTKTTSKPAPKASSNAATSVPLIVLGYDDQHKPHGARFQGADAKLVIEAAKAMGLNVYEAAAEDLAALAKKLPTGAAVLQWQRVCAKHQAEPVQRVHIDPRADTTGRARQR